MRVTAGPAHLPGHLGHVPLPGLALGPEPRAHFLLAVHQPTTLPHRIDADTERIHVYLPLSPAGKSSATGSLSAWTTTATPPTLYPSNVPRAPATSWHIPESTEITNRSQRTPRMPRTHPAHLSWPQPKSPAGCSSWPTSKPPWNLTKFIPCWPETTGS